MAMKIVFILYIPTRKGFYTYDEKKAFPTEIGPSGIMEVGIDNRSLYGDMIFLPKNFFGPPKRKKDRILSRAHLLVVGRYLNWRYSPL